MATKRKKPSNIKAKAPVPAGPGQTAKDDTEITALALKPGKPSPGMESYFAKCVEKLGFVPNVLTAYAFDNAKLEAFVTMYNDLMLAPSGLSKLEREMIAVAVSSVAVWLGPAGRARFALILLGFFRFVVTSQPPRKMLTEAYNPSAAKRNHYSPSEAAAIDSHDASQDRRSSRRRRARRALSHRRGRQAVAR